MLRRRSRWPRDLGSGWSPARTVLAKPERVLIRFSSKATPPSPQSPAGGIRPNDQVAAHPRAATGDYGTLAPEGFHGRLLWRQVQKCSWT
jgi:hypothetical protein